MLFSEKYCFILCFICFHDSRLFYFGVVIGGISAIAVAVVQNYSYVAYVENLWKCHKPVHHPGW